MNAIVNGCMPWLKQDAEQSYCGSYLIDLTKSNQVAIGRSITKFPVGASCTYRAVTKCGYPQAYWRVNNPKVAGDFDIAFASVDNMTITDELDGWEPKILTGFNGSYASTEQMEYTSISQAAQANAVISEDEWTNCNGIPRNLYLTVTRLKDSSKSAENTE